MRPELVIYVGLQGAGKSTFFRAQHEASHLHVSKDLMRSARDKDRRQQEQIREALEAGRSVVVDNTNPDPPTRAPLIELGRALGARVVAVFFDVPVESCLARNRGREGPARVPEVAIFATRKRLVPPSPEEGFDEVLVVRPGEAPAPLPPM